MKKIIIFFIIVLFLSFTLFFIFNFFNNNNKILITKTFKLNFPKDIKIEKKSNDFIKKYIFTYKENVYSKMVRFDYFLKYKNQNILLNIFLKPKDEISLEDLKYFTKIEKETYANANFGMGDSYKLLKSENYNTKKIKINNRNAIIFLSNWGSSFTRDILVYNFEINNKAFDNCLIEFYNVWPDNYLPENYNLNFIEDLIKKNDDKVIIYNLIDNAIKNINFLDNLKK